MRKALVVGAGMAALALAACASSDVSKAGDIYVKANGVEIQAGGIATFPAATGGSTSSLMKVVIGNAGDAPLTITRITIEEGGNAFMSFNPLPADRDFPHVVDANELTGDTAYQFQIKYNPGSQFDDRKTRIRIESDDHDEGEFLLIVEPQAKAPKIKVVPDNITFVGATSSDPGVQCFEIRNTGTAVLQLTDNLTFELPTSEFQIIPPNEAELEGFQVCRKDTKIDPDGQDGANLPCKFCVRYKPADTPDTNYVVIKSNDPDNESKRVKVEGQTDPGDLQVTKPDPTCLDFTAVEEVGATCTKIVKLYNNGTGGVTVDRPKLRPTTQKSYSVDWYKVDAATTTGACTYTPAPNALIPASQTQFRLDPGDSVDVAVTYNSPGGNGESGTLVIEYHQPFAGTAEVQLCGGAEKCNLELSPPTGTQLVFHGNVPDVKKKTLVLMNKGNGACTVNYVRVPDDLQACDVEGSFVVNPPVNGTAVPAFGLVPVTVEFRTDLDEKFVISNCQVEVSYVDSLTGTEQFPRINMTGHRGDFEGVDLPVAVPEALPLVEGEPFVKGVPFTLDGSGSTTGTHPIFEDGYRWFVTAKPAGSQVFLNEQAGPAQTTVTPDATGQYEFRLVVFSVSDDGKGFFFSDEGVLKLTVVQ